MLHPIDAGRNIPADYQAYPTRMNGFVSDDAAGVFQITERYKLADRKIKAGCELFRAGEKGDAIYSFIEGWVALYNLLEDGRRQILQFALPGTVLAFVPSRGGVMNYGALALTNAVVSVTTHERLGRISLDNPEIGMRLAGLISQDRNLAYDQLSSIGCCAARERVAHLLLDLFIRCRMRWPGHCIEEMHLPLTQEHIGDATSLTGVHVNRVLRELREDGIVEFHYRRLRIMNPDKLADVAGIDPRAALLWLKDPPASGARGHHQHNGGVQAPVRVIGCNNIAEKPDERKAFRVGPRGRVEGDKIIPINVDRLRAKKVIIVKGRTMIASGAIKNREVGERISRGAMTPSRPIRLAQKYSPRSSAAINV